MSAYILGDADFFYTFEELPPDATAARIRRECKQGTRRLRAFEHFMQTFPDDVTYVHGYVAAYKQEGIYDLAECAHLLGLIDRGLHLPDRSGCHGKLRKLEAHIAKQQRDILTEFGPDQDDNRQETHLQQFRRGKYDAIISRFEELKSTVKPRGILGGPLEKEYWSLLDLMCCIAFAEGQPELAMSRLAEREQGRIAVGLTPLPDFGTQEAVLGYLAKQDIGLARKRLHFWLINSKVRCISDVIKHHPAFADLCRGLC